MRSFHRRLAIIFCGFLTLSASTGLLWAYAPHLYWKEDYLKPKHAPSFRLLSEASVRAEDALQSARDQLTGSIRSITLKTLGDRLVYEIRYASGQGEHSWLLDAETGQKLTPIPDSLAIMIAKTYVRNTPSVKLVRRLWSYKIRGDHATVPVYQIIFDAPDHPLIIVNAESGTVLEDEDDSRRFHSWIMKLHTLSFFDFHKTLTLIPGLGLLAMVGTGLKLYWKRSC